MNAPEPRQSVFVDDKQIVDEIVELLPQDAVESLRDRIVQDGVYDKPFAGKFSLLRQRLEHIGFQPRTTSIRSAFESFKDRFIDLDEVLIANFALDRRGVLSLHANRHGELKDKLRYLYRDFEKSYKTLLKTAAEADTSNRPRIHIGAEKGIYIDDERRYPISGKRFSCVQRLLEASFLTTSDLKELWPTTSQITNEIDAINELTRRSLRTDGDLIVYSRTARHYTFNSIFEILPD